MSRRGIVASTPRARTYAGELRASSVFPTGLTFLSDGQLIGSAEAVFLHHAVSTRLNTAKNDDEKLLEPLADSLLLAVEIKCPGH